MISKKCNRCEEEKSIDQFDTNGWNGGKRDGKRKYHPYCKLCFSILREELFISRITEALEDIPLECSVCGFDKFPALDFHHIDPTTKYKELSGMRNYSYEKIKTEVDKCVILCSNCHRLYHHGDILI